MIIIKGIYSALMFYIFDSLNIRFSLEILFYSVAFLWLYIKEYLRLLLILIWLFLFYETVWWHCVRSILLTGIKVAEFDFVTTFHIHRGAVWFTALGRRFWFLNHLFLLLYLFSLMVYYLEQFHFPIPWTLFSMLQMLVNIINFEIECFYINFIFRFCF